MHLRCQAGGLSTQWCKDTGDYSPLQFPLWNTRQLTACMQPISDCLLACPHRALKFSFSVDTRLLHRPRSAPPGPGSALATFRRNSAAASFQVEIDKNAPFESKPESSSNERLVRFLQSVSERLGTAIDARMSAVRDTG